MGKIESKKSNRTLLFIGGGCVVLLLCVVCIGAAAYLERDQIIASFGGVQNTQALPPPTSAPNSGASTSSALPATATTAAQAPSSGNTGDTLLKAFTSWGSVKSFRAKMTVSGSPAAAQTMTMEMVMPDRMHMTSAQFEMIVIANTTYLKIGNQWQKMTLPQSQSFDVNLFNPKNYETKLQNPGALPDIKILGPDTVEGVPTIAYQITSPAQSGTPTATTKVWIGVADGFPHKIESGTSTGTATIIFSDFNSPAINITAPIP